MPLGNGELGINLWIEENGDLLFYLSRNDSYSEVSQLCKVGKVRVSLSPNPFTTGKPFRQELKISDGVCEITAGKAEEQVSLKVFVDAAHPVVHVVGNSMVPTLITAKVESWRTEKALPHSAWTLSGSPEQFWQSADVFPSARPDSVSWYHRNETSPAFESTIKLQSLESIRKTLHDPVLHRTFGGWIAGSGFKSTDDRALASWRSFWDRSWVICEEGLDEKDAFSSNNLPLRVGVASNNSEKFQGSIGAASVIGKPISEEADFFPLKR